MNVPTDRSFLAGIAVGAGLATLTALMLASKQQDKLEGTTREEKCINGVFKRAKKGDPASVLRVIDEDCWKSNWMMNIGDVKGNILKSEILKAKPRLVLEFGGYCGYSAVLIGSCLPPEAKLISIEINPVYAAIATKIIEFAGLSSKVSVYVADVAGALPAIVKEHGAGSVDAVFIDHWKTCYLPDLKNLESSKLLHVGSVIIADNILYPGAPEYLKYVSEEPRYSTKLHHSCLEYSKDVDAVAVSMVQSS